MCCADAELFLVYLTAFMIIREVGNEGGRTGEKLGAKRKQMVCTVALRRARNLNVVRDIGAALGTRAIARNFVMNARI